MSTSYRRRVLRWLVPGLGAAVLVTMLPATAAGRPHFQLPFACGETWIGSTRASHSPSQFAIDWNRDAYDEGHPVVASAPGVVTTVQDLRDTSYGLYVVVDHGGGWTTLHAHLDRSFVVVGQRVDQGQVIGLLGSSGGSTGAHLHYEQRLDRTDQRAVFDGTSFAYNSALRSRDCPDVPVVGDWNANGHSDVGVFGRRPAAGVFRERLPSGRHVAVEFGVATDQPVVGDWNGDGQSDLGVWSTNRRQFVLSNAGGGLQSFRFGRRGDVAVAGDWNGDGRWDVGVFRPATATFHLRDSSGNVSRERFGTASSLPVAGDWDGDGHWQVGVYDATTSTFSLATAAGGARTVVFGGRSSLPVVGSWNADETTDLGVWDPSTGVFSERLGAMRTRTVRFGHIR